MGHSAANRGSISVPVGRKFLIQSPVDCSVSIDTVANAVLGSAVPAQLKAGIGYLCFIPAGSPAVVLSGVTTDPNGDTSPTQLTFIDSGTSGI